MCPWNSPGIPQNSRIRYIGNEYYVTDFWRRSVHLYLCHDFSMAIIATTAVAQTRLFRQKMAQNNVSLQLFGKTQNTGNERKGHHRSKIDGDALGGTFPGAEDHAKN